MLTLKEAKKIVKDNKHFYLKTVKIDGYEISLFNYNESVTYEDFKLNNALELRGLSFVEGKPFPMIHKFFNLGEEEDFKISLNKKIKSIQTKDDGTLISYIQLPNRNIITKTKMGFDNKQVKLADKLICKETIKQLFEKENIIPYFEVVSKDNKIVLEYLKDELILIQARDINTFKYISVERLNEISNKYNIPFKSPILCSLEELLSLQKKEKNIEGFVLRFEDDSFIKIKTDWYFDKHIEDVVLIRANEIIDNIFKNKPLTLFQDYEKTFLIDMTNFIKEYKISTKENFIKIFYKNEIKSEKRILYSKIYSSFKKEFQLNNSIETNNGLINIILENRLDDYLSKLSKDEKVKKLFIQDKLFKLVDNEAKKIFSFQGLSRKTIALNMRTSLFTRISFQDYNDLDEVKKSIIIFIKKEIRKKSFVKLLFSNLI